MDSNLIPALAALGAAAGGTASFLGSWLVHRRQVRSQWLTEDKLRREDLYREFIEEASKCYLHALQHHQPDISLLVALYAKMSRMRIQASPSVLATAEQAVRRIIDTYSESDVTLTDLNVRTMLQQGSFDVLRDFSEKCRAEFNLLLAQQF
jgi:uncharacterized Rossmann fold enzyme